MSMPQHQPDPRRRLGRGLAALIGDDTTEEAVVEETRSLRQLPIEFIRRNPRNPRRDFREEDIAELAASIRERGILQPLIVRPVEDEQNVYEIVAGERRWRAAQAAGVHSVPVIIRTMGDAEALEIALVENIQRSDLSPLEEAEGYHQLIDRFGYTQQQLSEVIGKSRSHVANTLRLLNLPAEVRDHLAAGRITAGHARTLIAADNPVVLAEQIVTKGLSVREAERLAKDAATDSRTKRHASASKDADVRALEASLTEALGLKVTIAPRSTEAGELRISYASVEQFDHVCRRLLGRSPG